MGRTGRTAACINNAQLLVTGGLDKDMKTLGDVWLFDLHTWRWKEVSNTQATKLGSGANTYNLARGQVYSQNKPAYPYRY